MPVCYSRVKVRYSKCRSDILRGCYSKVHDIPGVIARVHIPLIPIAFSIRGKNLSSTYKERVFPNDFSIHSAIISKVNGINWKFMTGDPGCDGFDQSWQDCKKAPLPDPYPSVWLFK